MSRKKPVDLNNYGRMIRNAAKVYDDNEWCKGFSKVDKHIDPKIDIVSWVEEQETATLAFNYKEVNKYSFCVRGALGKAYFGLEDAMQTYKDPTHNAAIKAFCNFLRDSGQRVDVGIDPDEIHYWNDSVVTSKEEVVAWMNKFADWSDPQN